MKIIIKSERRLKIEPRDNLGGSKEEEIFLERVVLRDKRGNQKKEGNREMKRTKRVRTDLRAVEEERKIKVKIIRYK